MLSENLLLDFINPKSFKKTGDLKFIFNMFYEEIISSIEDNEEDEEKKKINKPTSSFYSAVRSLTLAQKEIENVVKRSRKKKGLNILSEKEKEKAYAKIYNGILWNISEDREKEIDTTLLPPTDEWLSEAMEEDNDKAYFENYEDEAKDIELYYYKYSKVLECSFGGIMREFSSSEVNDEIEISEYLISRDCFYCKNYERCFNNCNEEKKENKFLTLVKEGENYFSAGHKVYLHPQTNITNDFKNIYEGSEYINYESEEYKTDYAEAENIDNSRWIEYLNTCKSFNNDENSNFITSKYFEEDFESKNFKNENNEDYQNKYFSECLVDSKSDEYIDNNYDENYDKKENNKKTEKSRKDINYFSDSKYIKDKDIKETRNNYFDTS